MVLRALQWLKKNNKYYCNILLNEEALSQLPEDGDITNQCGVVTEDASHDEEEQQPATADEGEEPYGNFLEEHLSIDDEVMDSRSKLESP